jgi:hypothetical protein
MIAAPQTDRAEARKPRRCELCGKLFQPSRSDARYCSGAHKQEAYRRRNGNTVAFGGVQPIFN